MRLIRGYGESRGVSCSIVVTFAATIDCHVRGSNPGQGRNLDRDFCFMYSAPRNLAAATKNGTCAGPKPGHEERVGGNTTIKNKTTEIDCYAIDNNGSRT